MHHFSKHPKIKQRQNLEQKNIAYQAAPFH